MPKIPASRLEPGMTLAKPVATKNGMVMLGEGTTLTAKWIERIQDIGIANIYVVGSPDRAISKEEALNNLHARFSRVAGKPYMDGIKKIVQEHIEGIYEQS